LPLQLLRRHWLAGEVDLGYRPALPGSSDLRFDTRLIDLIVISVSGSQRPRTAMMGAAGIVALL
jgi:hypothetical protein